MPLQAIVPISKPVPAAVAVAGVAPVTGTVTPVIAALAAPVTVTLKVRTAVA